MYNYFYIIYFNVLLLAVIIESLLKVSIRNVNAPTDKKNFNVGIFILVIILSVILGFRPGSTSFGDTQLYQYNYEYQEFPNEDEPIFNLIGKVCYSLGLPTGLYLSIIAFLYIYLPLLFLNKYSRAQWLSLLMILASFSFLGYGVNGIRNGLSLSILIYSFIFVDVKGKTRWIQLFICYFIAIGIHKSSMLPISCMLISILFIKEPKVAMILWALCIPLSYIAGSNISKLFLGLGFDERLDQYLVGGFFTTGFRWDFILYSTIPILLAYYIIYFKKVPVDRVYSILVNTYILSNALWIIIIKSSFSNRFAYLSWFLYPIVLVYPLLRFKIWNNQTTKIAVFLFFYYMFTYVMLLPTY